MSISITATTSETSVTASSTATTVTVSDPTISLAETVSLTGFSAGNLLDLSGSTFNVDLSELTDMTDDVVGGTDELVLLDNSVQRRKLFSEIGLSSFNNDITTFSSAVTMNSSLTINNDFMEIVSTDTGATAKPVLSLYRNSASPATNEDMGAIRFFGENSSGEKVFYAGIDGGTGSSVGDGSHVGKLTFYLADGSSSGSAVTDVSADVTTDEDPVMSLHKYGLVMASGNDIFFGAKSDTLTWDTGSHEQDLRGRDTELTGGNSVLSLPDATQGTLEVGSLGGGAVVTGTSIAHATFGSYRGQKVVFTGSGNCTIGLPDAAAADVGATWTVCNASSANVIFDLDASAAQTLKILTGAAVTTVGTDNPHIVPGGVASLVCTAADNYILFGSGVVDN